MTTELQPGYHHLGTNTWAVGARVAAPEDARLLEWELRPPTRDAVAAAAANAATAGYQVRADADDRLMTDSSGMTVRLTKRSHS